MTEDKNFHTPEGVRWLWRRHIALTLEDGAKEAINRNSRAANLEFQDLSQAFWPRHLPDGCDIDDPWLTGRHIEPGQSLMGLQMLGYRVSVIVLNARSGHYDSSFPIEPVDRDGRDLLAIARDVISGKGSNR